MGAERSDPSQLRRSKAPPAHVASQPRQGPTTWSDSSDFLMGKLERPIYLLYIYMYMCVYLFNSIYILSFILYLLGTMVPFPVHLPLHPSNERSVYLRALIVERAQDSGSTSLESTQQKWLDNQLGFNTICGLDLSAWGSSKTGADPKLLCICIIIIISYNMLWYLMSTYILWYFIIMMPHF